jgi:hypothetical protein
MLWKSEDYHTTSIIRQGATCSINKLSTGFYNFGINLKPYDIETLRISHDPIRIEYTVEIKKGNKLKKKKFSFLLEGATTGRIAFLFEVPSEFFWSNNANLQITIVELDFDELFSYYYETFCFELEYHPLFSLR